MLAHSAVGQVTDVKQRSARPTPIVEDKAMLLRRSRAPIWVTRVVLCNRRLPVHFRYAPFATELRGAAICRDGPFPDVIGSSRKFMARTCFRLTVAWFESRTAQSVNSARF